MSNKVEYLLNYPEVNINLYSERYYGYIKDLPERLVSIVDEDFDWKNSRIAIVNDFAFHVTKYLLRNKNIKPEALTILITEKKYLSMLQGEFGYFGISIDYIDVENKKMTTDKKFDLIIANPPYSNSFYKKIVEVCANNSDGLSLLCPWDLVTSVSKGAKFRSEKLDNHVEQYTQISGMEYFGVPLQLFLGYFNLKKNTRNKLLPFVPGSVDEKIVNKLQNYKFQIKDFVFYQGYYGNDNLETGLQNVNKSYGKQQLVVTFAIRRIQSILTSVGEIAKGSSWGIKNSEGLNLIQKSANSDAWKAVLIYLSRLVGDGQNLDQRIIKYLPLFTKFEELELTEEEVQRIMTI